MISTPHRQTAVALINEAVTAGARRAKACAVLDISDRTLRRWTKGGEVQPDQRPLVPRPEPRNKLSAEERAAVLEVCNSAEFASLPPSQIVPKLADQGRYLASESSFYRILRADGQQHHRGRAKPPVQRKPPASYKASAPCEVWTWDITWMPGPVAGMFFYLYLIVDIFRWDGCRPPRTASQCAKMVVLKATKRGGRRDEGYDDRGGPSKACFPAPWGGDDGGGEVPQEAVTGAIPGLHGHAASCFGCV
ncbi:helix-turn-helix domain-containing protein [Roseovarius gahaiensis]|uniref:helix-turn-helix domain-containing protein n=1 Tax=Roseovarius gahaiensis TaxID=2716691 RepID=UPI001E3D0F86|nr:helix-turn-helix domain-containing protein [Roseovarius gahaiensis]